MFDIDKWQEIFNTISKHKLRTFLTALGVYWGIFMLVLLMGAGKGLENGVMGLFGGHAKNSLYIWANRTSLPYKGLAPGRRAKLNNDDIRAIQANFKEQIQYISPRVTINSGEVLHGENKGAFDVRGDTPDLVHIDAIELDQGRFLNDLDLKYRRKIAIIGKRVVDVLFPNNENPIGSYIKINGIDYLVVGTFLSNRRGGQGVRTEKNILIPLTTAQQINNTPNRIHWFVCAMYPNISASKMEADIKNLLKERHHISPKDQQGIGSENVEKEFREIQNLFIGIKFIVWFVGIGSLFAGIIGVGNIMLIVVKERTKEIGIRKAMGATPGSIISMVLLESVFITTIAGYIGLAFSTGLIVLMNMAVGEDGPAFYANPEVDLKVGVIALFILIISGALIGLIPATHAANINPVDALKDE